jgi:acyl carrier protein phosphodiesterase
LEIQRLLNIIVRLVVLLKQPFQLTEYDDTMNFLAHIYLSGDNDEIKVGNFVADWIKGSDHKFYATDIQKGILIHRAIDSFTDNHAIARQSKSYFAAHYGKYAGIIIDILYDHFLAIEWNKLSDITLNEFAQNTYNLLLNYLSIFPPGIQEFVPRFIQRRWLETYATTNGIKNVLTGMSKHTSLPDHTDKAIEILHSYYDELTKEFREYFPQLVSHVEENFGIVIVTGKPKPF